MKNRSGNVFTILALLALLTLSLTLSTALAQGTAFTYQGQLQNNGSLANGTYNLQFSLYTNSVGGAVMAGPVTNSAVTVTDGLFTVIIDFGSSVWNGQTNWLQIGVETNNATSFTLLTPRQQITPVPYAIFAEGANAAGLSGTVPMSSLSGTYGGTVSLTNAGNSFTGSGSGLSGVNASTLGGLPAGNFWQVGGNNGVPTGSNYIGNNDNQYLDIHANGVRVFRLRLFTDGLGVFTNAPNVIGGSSVNLTAPNVVGAVIDGGGGNDTNGVAHGNEVYADFGTIVGGLGNTNYGIASFIGGGGYNGTSFAGNTINANVAVIGGGFGNSIPDTGSYSFIGGGYSNSVSQVFSVVGGGQFNSVPNAFSVVSGGAANTASGAEAAVGGGYGNTASGFNATIGGGESNLVSGQFAMVGGGVNNSVSGVASFIGGGGFDGTYYFANTINDDGATICGGAGNSIPSGGAGAFIGGGESNFASGSDSTVGGGYQGYATGIASFVGGGGYDENILAPNEASGAASVIVGGVGNVCSGADSVIGGGDGNTNGGIGSFIGGGGYDGSTYAGNFINANAATIGGGVANKIPEGSRYAFIGGGADNSATAYYATVGGGLLNYATASAATVVGGYFNFAEGTNSTVPGGYFNGAYGICSFAAGNSAEANYNGSFAWSDNTGTGVDDTGANQFVARASGGFFFYTGTGSSGAKLASGATSWTTLCDRNAKKNFQPVDTVAVLDKLATVPIEKWNYKWEKDSDVPNIGPMAQDFIAAFYPGRDNKGITTLEFDGVELAAIQGLNQKLEADNAELKQQNSLLAKRLDELEAEVKALAQNNR